MHSLPLFLRLTGEPVILIGEGPVAEARRRLLTRAGARIIGEDQAARIAFVTGEEPEQAAARLKARGLLLNVADRPDLCDFTLPAIVDRDPVIVAIGTGGASAGLAAALRQRLEALLPASLGKLAIALHGARASLKARLPDATDRRRVLGQAFAPGGPLDPLGSDVPDPVAALDAPSAPRVETIIVASPDPDELTLRTARLLGLADRLYHPPGVPAALLDRARADAARIVGAPPALPPPGLSIEIVWRP